MTSKEAANSQETANSHRADDVLSPPRSSQGDAGIAPSRPRRWLRRILGAVLVVLFLYGLALFGAERRLTHALRDHSERLGSLDFADFIPPELPAGTANASEFLEAAIVLAEGQAAVRVPLEDGAPPPPPELTELHASFRRLDPAHEAPSAENLSFFRGVVERHAAVLDVLDRATTIVDARYATDYSVPPVSIVVPNLLARLRLAFLLRARAHVAHADHRPEDAWDDAAGIFRLAHWCARETPTTINVIVGQTIANQAAELTRHLLADSPPGEDERARLLEEARRVDPQALFAHVLAAERAATVSSALDERVPRGALYEALGGPSLPFVGRLWVRFNVAVYIESVTPTLELCALPTHRQGDSQARIRELAPPNWAVGARILMWNFLDLSQKRDAWVATLDHLELALHLEEARREDGQYPESLDELDLPFVDPFSGEPYRYRKEDGGYVLWSVFADRHDDGGVPQPLNEQGQVDPSAPGDYVWNMARR